MIHLSGITINGSPWFYLIHCGHWSCDRHTLRSYHAHDNAEAGLLARFFEDGYYGCPFLLVHCQGIASLCSVEFEGYIGNYFSGLHMPKCPLLHVFFSYRQSGFVPPKSVDGSIPLKQRTHLWKH